MKQIPVEVLDKFTDLLRTHNSSDETMIDGEIQLKFVKHKLKKENINALCIIRCADEQITYVGHLSITKDGEKMMSVHSSNECWQKIPEYDNNTSYCPIEVIKMNVKK